MRVATYTRVSSDEQARHGGSLREQARQAADYADRQGWTVVATYEDAGISGSREDRPALQRLLANLDGLDVVIVWSLDRLSRDMALMLDLARRFKEAGVRLESLTAHVDLTTPEGELSFNLASAVAEFERRRIGERVSASMPGRVRAGKHLGATTYGYERHDGKLVPVAHEAEIVRRIFREYAAGSSANAIQRVLNRDGIPPMRGKRWYQETVGRMVRNVIYRGAVRYRGQEFEGAHEAIVSVELWGEANRLLAARASGKGKGRGRPAKGPHLFVGGLLNCGTCGEPMVPRGNAYRCLGRLSQGTAFCPRTPVPRALVDEAAYAHFEATGLDVEATREHLAIRASDKLAEIQTLRAEAQREAHRAAERLTRVRRAFQDGLIEPQDWSEQRRDLTIEADAAAAEADRLLQQEGDVRESWERLDAEDEALRALAEIRAAIAGEVKDAEGVDAARAALVRLFERFTLHSFGHPNPVVPFPTRASTRLFVPGENALSDALYIEPRPRAAAIEASDRLGFPILRRTALTAAANKTSDVSR